MLNESNWNSFPFSLLFEGWKLTRPSSKVLFITFRARKFTLPLPTLRPPIKMSRVNSTSNLWKIWKLFNLGVGGMCSRGVEYTVESYGYDGNSWIKKIYVSSHPIFESYLVWSDLHTTFLVYPLHWCASQQWEQFFHHLTWTKFYVLYFLFFFWWEWLGRGRKKMMNNKSQFPIFLFYTHMTHERWSEERMLRESTEFWVSFLVSHTRWCSYSIL